MKEKEKIAKDKTIEMNKELEKLVTQINKAGLLIKKNNSVIINSKLQKKICKLF